MELGSFALDVGPESRHVTYQDSNVPHRSVGDVLSHRSHLLRNMVTWSQHGAVTSRWAAAIHRVRGGRSRYPVRFKRLIRRNVSCACSASCLTLSFSDTRKEYAL